MAKSKTILDLIDDLEPIVRKAFLISIANIKSGVPMKALEAAIRSGDTEAVIKLLGIGTEYFMPLERALRETYGTGGDWAMSEIAKDAAKAGIIVRSRFNDRNPRAELYLSERSSFKITGRLTEDTRQAVRDTLEAGMRAGRGPQSVALDIVGRIDRTTGKRTGGIIGLSRNDRANRDRALAELLSGDPDQMRNYLKRSTRDRRLDALVRSAINSGKPVSSDDARKIITRMEGKLLRNRGETIARTELLGSLHHAGDEAMRQLIDSGQIRADLIENEWDAQDDAATRSSHRHMDGDRQPFGMPFTTGNNFQMMFPGDTSLGAPAKEIINCRCYLRRHMNWVGMLGPGD